MKKIFLVNVFFLTFLGIFGINVGEIFGASCSITASPNPATVVDNINITITGSDPDSSEGGIWGYELWSNGSPTGSSCSPGGPVTNLTCPFTKKFTTAGDYNLQCWIILSPMGHFGGSKTLTVSAANQAPVADYALTVSKAGTGSGTVASNPAGINCGTDCLETYNSGVSVTLNAVAASGYSFASWGGACAGNNTNSCTVTMNASKSVTATFNTDGSGPGPGPGRTIPCLGSTMDSDDLKTYRVGNRWVAYDGLVPCGKCSLMDVNADSNGKYLSGGTATDKISCQLCHIFVMIKGIVDFILFQLVPVIAVLLLTVGGVMYVISRGNPSQLTQAKNILTSTVVGLVIIFASWLIGNTIFILPGFMNPLPGWDPTKWFEVNCNITLPAAVQ